MSELISAVTGVLSSSPFLSVIAGIATALVSVFLSDRVRKYRKRKSIMTGLVAELMKNAVISKTYLAQSDNERINGFGVGFHDKSYEKFVSSGELLTLDDESRSKLMDSYLIIDKFNNLTMPGATPPDEAYQEMKALSENLEDLHDGTVNFLQEGFLSSFWAFNKEHLVHYKEVIGEKWDNADLSSGKFINSIARRF